MSHPNEKWAIEGVGTKPSDNDVKIFRSGKTLKDMLSFNREFVKKHYNCSYLYRHMFGCWRKVCKL